MEELFRYLLRKQPLIDARGNKTLNYSYSPGGLLNYVLDSDGNRTDYQYDRVSRLISIWAANYDYVSFTYDAGGRLTEKLLSSGVDAKYTYNPDNTLASLANVPSACPPSIIEFSPPKFFAFLTFP